MLPATFTIGDDLTFRADNVKSGRTPFAYLPEATLTYELLHAQTRESIAIGTMSVYDEDTASFEGHIDKTNLEEYDAEDNPNGIKPLDLYALRVIVDNNGIQTTKAALLLAVQDPDSSFE